MIEFRWMVKIHEYKVWDARWDEWRETKVKGKPVLQYREDFEGKWKDIPVVEIK